VNFPNLGNECLLSPKAAAQTPEISEWRTAAYGQKQPSAERNYGSLDRSARSPDKELEIPICTNRIDDGALRRAETVGANAVQLLVRATGHEIEEILFAAVTLLH